MNIVKMHIYSSVLLSPKALVGTFNKQVKGAIIRSLFLKLPRNSVDTFIEDTYVSQQERM